MPFELITHYSVILKENKAYVKLVYGLTNKSSVSCSGLLFLDSPPNPLSMKNREGEKRQAYQAKTLGEINSFENNNSKKLS